MKDAKHHLCINTGSNQCAPLGAILFAWGQQAGAELACQLDVEAYAAILQLRW